MGVSRGMVMTTAMNRLTPETNRRRVRIDGYRLLRRTHMYAGLLLFPAVVIYGVSGYAFNHPTPDAEQQPAVTHMLTTLSYGPPAPAPAAVAPLLAYALQPPAHGAGPTLPARLVHPEAIHVSTQLHFLLRARDTLWDATYTRTLDNGDVRLQAVGALSWPQIAGRLHVTAEYPGRTQVGVQRASAFGWAIVVDLIGALLVFWGCSGLLMWWQNRSQRRTGLLFGALCIALTGTIAGTVYVINSPLSAMGVEKSAASSASSLPSSPPPASQPAAAHAQDSATAQLHAHVKALRDAWEAFDPLRMHGEIDTLLALRTSGDRAIQRRLAEQHVFDDSFGLIWIELAAAEDPAVLPAVLHRLRILDPTDSAMWTRAWILQNLGPVGLPVPVLQGHYWFHMEGDSQRPRLGQPSLMLTTQNLTDTLLQRIMHQYGPRGLDLTLVLALTGHTPTGEAATAAQEVEADRQFYGEFLHWPGAIVIQEPPSSLHDGQRVYGDPPYAQTYGTFPVLSGRSGLRYWTADGGQPSELEVAVQHALAQ